MRDPLEERSMNFKLNAHVCYIIEGFDDASCNKHRITVTFFQMDGWKSACVRPWPQFFFYRIG